jgi:hypothetical protein
MPACLGFPLDAHGAFETSLLRLQIGPLLVAPVHGRQASHLPGVSDQVALHERLSGVRRTTSFVKRREAEFAIICTN